MTYTHPSHASEPVDPALGLDALDHDLALVARATPHAGLAARALAATHPLGVSTGLSSGLSNAFRGDWRHTFAVAAVVVLIIVVLGAVLLPALGTARASSRSLRGAIESSLPTMSSPAALSPSASPASPQSAARLVARTASMSLRVQNLRPAIDAALALTSTDQGEYVARTDISGVEPYASASVVLRVRTERLDSVLASLRALGQVRSESTGGEDVTDQVTDLTARLRNERRIEQELLELLSSRPDAPLEDVLRVRVELAKVRDSIERLDAQAQALTQRVELATVTVTLASANEPVAESQGLWGYASDRTAAAWRWSLRALADTIAFLVSVIVGGLVWWIGLVLIVIAIRRWLARRARRAAFEPAPRL
jgi:hypothetical protein